MRENYFRDIHQKYHDDGGIPLDQATARRAEGRRKGYPISLRIQL